MLLSTFTHVGAQAVLAKRRVFVWLLAYTIYPTVIGKHLFLSLCCPVSVVSRISSLSVRTLFLTVSFFFHFNWPIQRQACFWVTWVSPVRHAAKERKTAVALCIKIGNNNNNKNPDLIVKSSHLLFFTILLEPQWRTCTLSRSRLSAISAHNPHSQATQQLQPTPAAAAAAAAAFTLSPRKAHRCCCTLRLSCPPQQPWTPPCLRRSRHRHNTPHHVRRPAMR